MSVPPGNNATSVNSPAKMGGEEACRLPRWREMLSRTIVLPEPPSNDETIIGAPNAPTESDSSTVDYPLLRVLLRDSRYPFRPKYAQRDAAFLLGKTTRTLRNWIREGLVPFHVEPGGRAYFTPQDIEEILEASAHKAREMR